MSESNIHVIERDKSIIKPNNDIRDYCGLVLSNKLKVILISDPLTDKSAASLSINIGSLLDPWDNQGLAHLVEHALFVGSRKYPKDNSFKDFIVQHGGRTNGHTNHTETVYYFDVDTNFLGDALDQFAQFFIEPLFLGDKIERELDSVQLEFDNTRTIDAFRMNRVRKAVSDPKHEFFKFEFGSKGSLDSKAGQLYDELLKFYRKHYSANLMSLVVLGKESLSELEQLVSPLFNQIANHNLSPYWNELHPFSPKYCCKEVNIVPLKTMCRMSIFFPMPDPRQDLVKHEALAYVTHLLGHEGPGSLLSKLKEMGLSNTVNVHTSHLGGFSFLFIDLDLTKGVRANQEVLLATFQYIRMLELEPPSKRIFNEIKKINSVRFNYRDKFDPIVYVKYISNNLIKLPMKRALCGRMLMGKFNAVVIKEAIRYLTVETLNVHCMSTSYKNTQLAFKTEFYYGTQYAVKDINQETLDMCRNAQLNSSFYLPEPNQFIPENFELKGVGGKDDQQPRLIVKEEHFKLWHLLDEKYKVPKAFFGFFFKCFLFHDYVNKKFYSATLADIGYYLSTTKLGLVVEISGFNDKLADFTQFFIEELRNFRIDPKRFHIYDDICYNILSNFPTRPLLSQTSIYKEYILGQTTWTVDELKAAMGEISIEKVEALILEVLTHFELEVFVHGNVSSEEAKLVSRMIFNQLAQVSKIFPIDSVIGFDHNREIRLPDQIAHEWRMDNSIHENNALLVYFQIGLENIELLAQLQLFHQIIDEPYFNQIRMKEQLAYMTFVRVRYTCSGLLGFSIDIQSAYDLDYLEKRVEVFVGSIEEYISTLPMSTFEKEKASLITRLVETPKALFAYSLRLWNEITSAQYLFDRNEKLIAHLRQINDKNSILNLYKTHIARTGTKCRKLIIRIKSTKAPNLKGKEEDISDSLLKKSLSGSTFPLKRVLIENIRKFKCRQEYYSLAPMLVDNL